MRRARSVLSRDPPLNASRCSNTPVPCKLTSRRRPPAALFNFLERRRNQPLREFVPNLCQRIADLDVLADLVRRKNSKLRGLNGGSGTDSVPGHLIFNNLQLLRSVVSFHFIPVTFRAADVPPGPIPRLARFQS